MFARGTITVPLSTLWLPAFSATPNPNACVVSIERAGRTIVSVTEASRSSCIDATRFAGPQPVLSVETCF